MSSPPHQRTSEVAARQVEQIVAAAQEAAQEIREQAERERENLRRIAEREQEEALVAARKEAILMTQEARDDAKEILAAAKAESEQIREQTQRAVQGRVAAAEKAAADVLAEARALSGGLRQLGRSLEDHADRILRDVTAAHKRMQADLRVGAGPSPSVGEPSPEAAPDARAPRRTVTNVRPQSTPDAGPAPGAGRRRANPFDDLEVPSWE